MDDFTLKIENGNAVMLDGLRHLVAAHPAQAIKILNSAAKKCQSGQHEKEKAGKRALYKWIYASTEQLDTHKCSIQQRMHWLLNGLDDFPVCAVCGKPVSDPKRFKGLFTGYSDFCSVACAKKHGAELTARLRRQENGGKYFSVESLEKRKRAFIAHYGIEHNMKSETGKEELRKGVERKYGAGLSNVFQAEAIKEKSKATKLAKYGDENYSNRDKAAKTFKARPIEEKEAQRASFIGKSLEHFGVDHPMKDPSVARKSQANRKHCRYAIDGNYFDSLPELCFYVCCQDFKISVECHPADRAVEYFDSAGNRHFYYPDFYLPRLKRLVEIKGDHFFEGKDPRNRLVSRFTADPFSKARAKSEAMSRHRVLVLPSTRYLKY